MLDLGRSAAADPEADDQQGNGEQEPDAPAPLCELPAGQRDRQQPHDPGRQYRAERGARLRPGGPEPPAAGTSVLADHQHGGTELATERETLDQTQDDKRDRRPDARLRVRGQQPDGRRGQA